MSLVDLDGGKRLSELAEAVVSISNDCCCGHTDQPRSSDPQSTRMGVASTSRTLLARTTTHSLSHTDPCHILSDGW
jgi:hypothetical protein